MPGRMVSARSRGYRSLANGSDLSVLTPDEAFQLPTSRRKPAGNEEEEQARELANDLGHHALALDVAASALLSYSGEDPYRKFRDELSNYDEDALELARRRALGDDHPDTLTAMNNLARMQPG